MTPRQPNMPPFISRVRTNIGRSAQTSVNNTTPPRANLIRITITFALALCLIPTPALAQVNQNPLGNRPQRAHRDAVERFGGTRETERAVADGLAWLAAHQQSNGVWNRTRFERQCPHNDRCGQEAIDFAGDAIDVGLSALASLAFLGAGYTHEEGPYAETLSKSFSYILAQQDRSGSFAPRSGFQIYNDAVATLAIAECYALTKDPILKKPLERAVAHLVRAQQPRGGWDYTARQTNRNDSSITGWVVVALKSAHAVGIEVPLATRLKIIRHFDRATEPDGRVWYADRKKDPRPGENRVHIKRRYGPAMVATGLFTRAVLGLRIDDDIAQLQAARLLRDLPEINKLQERDGDGLHSEYYWYYGTLALFNIGGDAWRDWNVALRSALLEYQQRPTDAKNKKRHPYGSWPAFGLGWGKWGRTGGRIYSTAINTLTLEIYYRYVPSYLAPQSIISPRELRDLVDSADRDEQEELVRLAARFHADIAEPTLLDLLHATNPDARLDAAIELAMLGSPVVIDRLKTARDKANDKLRKRIDDALANVATIPSGTAFGRVKAVKLAAHAFLFEMGDALAFYDQRVNVMRDDEVIATAIVNRRFTGHNAAACRIVTMTKDIKEGDRVVTAGAE